MYLELSKDIVNIRKMLLCLLEYIFKHITCQQLNICSVFFFFLFFVFFFFFIFKVKQRLADKSHDHITLDGSP